MSSLRSLLLVVPLILLSSLALGSPAVTPQQALLLMGEAGRTLNYQGVFTYEHGGLLRAVRVQHARQNGESREHLLFLNGPYREILRLGDTDCGVEGVGLRDLGFGDTADVDAIESHYRLSLRGTDRVAGREVRLMYLEPRDELRYGYVFGLDNETGLLLQAMLVSEDGRVLERFQFSDISIGGDIDGEVFEVSPEKEGVTVLGQDCQNSEPEEQRQRWQANWLPPGFSLSAAHTDPTLGREVMTFSDGLAVFSVFVDAERGVDLPELQAQRGATIAFLAKQSVNDKDYAICVVGEVPAQTAQRVALSLAPR